MEAQSEYPSFFYNNMAGPPVAAPPAASRQEIATAQPRYSLERPAQQQSPAQPQYPALPQTQPQPRSTMSFGPAGSMRDPRYQNALVPVQAPPSTDNLKPIPRAAKTVNDSLNAETRYPELDKILAHGISYQYENMDQERAPFHRTNLFEIPDQIFEAYNQVQVLTKMGLFAEIGRAWIVVDHMLYLWNFSSGGDFQEYAEPSRNNILAVNLLKPRPGVFVDSVTHILLVATSTDINILGVAATPNGRPFNGCDLQIYKTNMALSAKGVNINIIEGSAKTGRIFFTGTLDNEVYELTYQEQEGWFQPRCGKICHTQTGIIAQFAPKISFLSGPQTSEHTIQMVIDDTRNLLYTLSSTSTIRVFHMGPGNVLTLAITIPFERALSHIRVTHGLPKVLDRTTPFVSISVVTSQQGRRANLVGTTTTGCRMYFSAASAYGSGYGGDRPPSDMQATHLRLPPVAVGEKSRNSQDLGGSSALGTTRKAAVFAPGYFICCVGKEELSDTIYMAAPDSAKILFTSDMTQSQVTLWEVGSWLDPESRIEAIQPMTSAFAATPTPGGFGNEMAVQFDQAPTEIAILTSNGIHIIKRRRYVEILANMIKYGSSNPSSLGVEGEVRKFFESYGRAEACATALAVACGALSADSFDSRAIGKVTDTEIAELARKFFIEFGGKARVENEYDSTSAPSLDSVRVSGRHDGLALYTTRIVRSIWKVHIVNSAATPGGGETFSGAVPVSKLQIIQEQLQRLSEFLAENRTYIEGLSGADSLMRVGTRVEEVAQQAEHRALHSLVQLISAMIEGISFVLTLLEDKLDEVIGLLPDTIKPQVKELTFEGLFTTDAGRALAKELIAAMVNRNIQAGASVDIVADTLRKRCGSFCSADDVVLYKAIEQLRKARDTVDIDTKSRLLQESEHLFSQVASTLSVDTLTDAMGEFLSLQFPSGAIRIALDVAKASDRGNLAIGYLLDGSPIEDPRRKQYEARSAIYETIFPVLEALDEEASRSPATLDGSLSDSQLRHQVAYQVVWDSNDEVFQSCLFDWFFSRGLSEKLLSFEGPTIVPYLKRRASNSIQHADLLWQYYSRREIFYDAAFTLRELAMSNFPIELDRRIEYLSRARGLSNCRCPVGSRQAMNELLQKIQEAMDVAMIQADILRKVKDDSRISANKLESLVEQLDGELLPLTDLFNRFADAYGYWDICLQIFQGADYHGTHEIKRVWQNLLTKLHTDAAADQSKNVHEVVSDEFRNLGHRFSLSEYIFPPEDLVPMLEIFAVEKVPDTMHTSWVPQTFLDAGVSAELLLRILDAMFYRDEVPFKGSHRKRLVRDAVYVADKWFRTAVKKRTKTTVFGGVDQVEGGFKKHYVVQTLERYKSILSGPADQALAEKLDMLLNDIRRG
ncbi:hypothetical protein TWF481_000386 [Arthrobotrys musiformis]|uniref:Non-repetitive nucleoporin n=1 Tax=Arthrobotrys musiformis TaxID=47236 RepID=A0AAV9WME6_9PEZI